VLDVRAQRRATSTATLVRKGNPTPETIDGALIEPLSTSAAAERAARTADSSDARDPRRALIGARPPLVGDTIINLPGVHAVAADDKITIDDITWRATGEGSVWLDRTKVPVTKQRPTA
jgi:hypothetical protein